MKDVKPTGNKGKIEKKGGKKITKHVESEEEDETEEWSWFFLLFI